MAKRAIREDNSKPRHWKGNLQWTKNPLEVGKLTITAQNGR